MKENKLIRSREVSKERALTYIYKEIKMLKEYHDQGYNYMIAYKTDKIKGALEFAESMGILTPQDVLEILKDIEKISK